MTMPLKRLESPVQPFPEGGAGGGLPSHLRSLYAYWASQADEWPGCPDDPGETMNVINRLMAKVTGNPPLEVEYRKKPVIFPMAEEQSAPGKPWWERQKPPRRRLR
jgi:hypothetical protein